VFTDEKAIAFFTNDMILAKIHAEEDTLARDKYYARAYPTSILIRKNGEEVDRLVGFDSTDAYLQTFVDFTNGIGTLDDLLGQAEGSEDRSLFMEIADKYKYRGSASDAEAWFTKVIEAGEPLDSLSGEARLSLAYMLRKAEDYEGALLAYRKVAEEFESYHGMDAVIYQAIVYRYMADTANAVATFESYIEQFPESPDVEYAQEQIEKLTNPPEEESEH
jgi:tetratricopeptide (TPR) repeat protein